MTARCVAIIGDKVCHKRGVIHISVLPTQDELDYGYAGLSYCSTDCLISDLIKRPDIVDRYVTKLSKDERIMFGLIKVELYVDSERTDQWKEDHPIGSTEHAAPHVVSMAQLESIVMTVFEDNGIRGMMVWDRGYLTGSRTEE